MRSARRWVLPLVLLLVVLLGWAPPASAAEEGTADDAATVDRVLVVGVPGLVWSDVDATTTPHLWEMAEQGSVGALSVRAARGTTCLLDGWATLGAGNRARFPGPDDGLPPVPLPMPPLLVPVPAPVPLPMLEPVPMPPPRPWPRDWSDPLGCAVTLLGVNACCST